MNRDQMPGDLSRLGGETGEGEVGGGTAVKSIITLDQIEELDFIHQRLDTAVSSQLPHNQHYVPLCYDNVG